MNRNRNYAVCDAGILHNASLRRIRRLLRLQKFPAQQPSVFDRMLDYFGVLRVSKPARYFRPRQTRSTR